MQMHHSTCHHALSAYTLQLHSNEEARRVYGVIAAGAQFGQLAASLLAASLYSHCALHT